jgi:hypothetical protein
MSYWQVYLWCALGIVVSVLLPVIWEAVHRYFPPPAARILGIRTAMVPSVANVWNAAKPYILLGVASLITALLIVAFVGDQLIDFKAALLAGYAWDSTLQKLRG